MVIVPAGAAGGGPAEGADIDGILQEVFHRPVFKQIAPVGADALGIGPLGEVQIAGAGNKPLKELADNDGFLWDGDKAVFQGAVAEGGGGLQAAAGGFFRHALFYLVGQVDGVVFGHGFQHGLENDGKLVILDGFRNGDDTDIAFPPEHGLIYNAVFTGAGKAVELVDQDDIKGVFPGFCLGDHGHEAGALFRLAAGDTLVREDIAVIQDHVVLGGVAAQGLQLGFGRIFRLIFGGDADVGRGDEGEAGGQVCRTGGHKGDSFLKRDHTFCPSPGGTGRYSRQARSRARKSQEIFSRKAFFLFTTSK